MNALVPGSNTHNNKHVSVVTRCYIAAAAAGFMSELLYELDSGASCLPPGSEIVFVNAHPPEDTLGVLLRSKSLNNVKVGWLI